MAHENPRIAILILGYNDEKNIKDALESAINQTYENYEIIYIDNASTDKSLRTVKENYPSLRTIANKKNLGYAGAYKKALQEFFKEDFASVVLLNSDVIVEKTWLSELVRTAYASDEIGMAQPKIFLWDGKENDLANTFGNKINYLGFGFCGHYKQKDSLEFNTDQEITYASGASLLVKKDAYFDAGELDEKFFAYLEDQDLGWRMQLMGYIIMLSARSKMIHKYKFQKNSRNSWKLFMLERNRLYFLYKNYSLKTILLILPAFLLMEIGVIVHSIFGGYLKDKLRSYVVFIKNIPALKKDRRKIQKERKFSDHEVFHKLTPTIDFEEINSPFLALMNLFLKTYYNIIKLLI